MKLKYLSTKELAEELRRREGVAATIAEPYEAKIVRIDGPAVVLVIID